MQGVEICKRNQHIPHYRKRKDANRQTIAHDFTHDYAT